MRSLLAPVSFAVALPLAMTALSGCSTDPPPRARVAAALPESAVQPASSAAPAGSAAAAAQKPVLNDWFALGSGCRARFDTPGDVTMERLTQDAARPGLYRARFSLPNYTLDSNAVKDPKAEKFARECAVRLNVNPPEGMRIKAASATTRTRASKSEGTKLTILSELKIGPSTLGTRTDTFEKGSRMDEQESLFDLRAGAKPEEAMPELKCGEAKILAFNYTWMAERATAAETTNVHLGGDRSLEFDVELEPCK
jgi:hypothetical protein